MRLLIALAVAMAASSVSARDLDGHYARENPGLHAWFESLQNDEGTPCCDTGDGIGIADIDWDSKDGEYRVRLDGQWVAVPDSRVIKQPNKYGPTMVWTYNDIDSETGKIRPHVRCFMPGSGS